MRSRRRGRRGRGPGGGRRRTGAARPVAGAVAVAGRTVAAGGVPADPAGAARRGAATRRDAAVATGGRAGRGRWRRHVPVPVVVPPAHGRRDGERSASGGPALVEGDLPGVAGLAGADRHQRGTRVAVHVPVGQQVLEVEGPGVAGLVRLADRRAVLAVVRRRVRRVEVPRQLGRQRAGLDDRGGGVDVVEREDAGVGCVRLLGEVQGHRHVARPGVRRQVLEREVHERASELLPARLRDVDRRRVGVVRVEGGSVAGVGLRQRGHVVLPVDRDVEVVGHRCPLRGGRAGTGRRTRQAGRQPRRDQQRDARTVGTHG
jgi:hypothetical protein